MARRDVEMARDYAQSETGAVIRDWGGQVPIALVYPNSYGVGMSSLAMHALYGLLNAQPGLLAERAFAWLDRRAQSDSPVLLLESQRPLSDAAVVAASLSFEMDYFHLIDLLRRAGIPPRAAERDASHPLVLLGGPAVSANPAPLMALADAILIGEIEPVLLIWRRSCAESGTATAPTRWPHWPVCRASLCPPSTTISLCCVCSSAIWMPTPRRRRSWSHGPSLATCT